MRTPINDGDEPAPEFRADTRVLSALCDRCKSRLDALNELPRLWGCDRCHNLACWHHLSFDDNGRRVCSRCPLT